MRALVFALTFLPLSLPVAAQSVTGDLLVTSRFTDEVLRYDGTTGAFVAVFASGGGLQNPVGLTFGPDGNLYVASAGTSQVLRYDGSTGAFLDVFASGGGLSGARHLNFGPDGALYVASGSTNVVLRYDGTTGASLGVFAAGGGLAGPTSFTFGPCGDLFVGSVLDDRVKRYDGVDGTPLGDFASTQLDGPHDVAFGPDGLLYVTNAFQTRIRRYHPVTGAFVSAIRDDALSAALGLAWDGHGFLYVANQGGDEVRRYAPDGTPLGGFVLPGAGGVSSPLFLAFLPASGGRRIGAPFPGTTGTTNYLHVTGARPGERLFLGIGVETLFHAPGCARERALLRPLHWIAAVADESGNVVFGARVPPSAAGTELLLQAVPEDVCAASPLTRFRF